MASIPWNEVAPLIQRWAEEGESFARIADSLNARYGAAISAATVQYHLDKAEDLTGVGYQIPARRGNQIKLTTPEVKTALYFANRTIGRPAKSPISIAEYDRVRDNHMDIDDPRLPSSIGIRRKFGSWSAACEACGVESNAPKRGYDGITQEDAVLWLAHWLRDLRKAPGIPSASAAAYRVWVRENDTAPSFDTLRNLGTWGDLLEEAAELESTSKRLAKPKPVSSGPRKHKLDLLSIP